MPLETRTLEDGQLCYIEGGRPREPGLLLDHEPSQQFSGNLYLLLDTIAPRAALCWVLPIIQQTQHDRRTHGKINPALHLPIYNNRTSSLASGNCEFVTGDEHRCGTTTRTSDEENTRHELAYIHGLTSVTKDMYIDLTQIHIFETKRLKPGFVSTQGDFQVCPCTLDFVRRFMSTRVSSRLLQHSQLHQTKETEWDMICHRVFWVQLPELPAPVDMRSETATRHPKLCVVISPGFVSFANMAWVAPIVRDSWKPNFALSAEDPRWNDQIVRVEYGRLPPPEVDVKYLKLQEHEKVWQKPQIVTDGDPMFFHLDFQSCCRVMKWDLRELPRTSRFHDTRCAPSSHQIINDAYVRYLEFYDQHG